MDLRTKQLADCILCVFETSSKTPRYSAIATLRDGPKGVRQITWGYHQGTDASNTVDEILEEFIAIAHADTTGSLDLRDARIWAESILPQFRANTTTSISKLAADSRVKMWLGVIGAMPEGREAQRRVFRRKYMEPAIKAVEGSGWVEPLSLVAVLDGMTHGSWARLRDSTDAKLSEKEWVASYLTKRYSWLSRAKHPLPATACRSESLLKLIVEDNWGLKTPFTLDLGRRGGFTITEDDLRVF